MRCVAAAIILTALSALVSHSILPQGHSISGRISVEGRGHNYGVIVWVDTQHMATTDSTGDYELGGLDDGEYRVMAWSPCCLVSVLDTVQISGADAVDVDGGLFAGDLNDDNKINLYDAGLILQAYGATPDSAAWDEFLDISGNGLIDSLDIAVLSGHWKERGDCCKPLTNVQVNDPLAWYLNQQDVEITWNTGFLMGEVSITLHRGANPVLLVDTIAESTDNDGFYTYCVPGDLPTGNDYRIKIYYDESYYDYSDAFSIKKYVYVEPDDATWYPGQQDVPVRVNCACPGGFVTTMVYKGDTPVDTISTREFSSWACYPGQYIGEVAFYYDVPAEFDVGSDYRVEAYIDDYYNDTAGVEVYEPDFEVTLPDSLTVWRQGRGYTICWDTGDLGGDVSFYLYKGDVPVDTITESTPNDNFFNYVVPSELPLGDDYRVYMYHNELCSDFSDTFSVCLPNFEILEPKAGTVWRIGEQGVEVIWDPVCFDGLVSISLATFEPFCWLADTTENDGYCLVDVPSWISPGLYKIYLSTIPGSSENLWRYGENFEIIPDLTWVQQETPVGCETDLWDVHFTDVDTGTVVGDLGTILHTTNGGEMWTSRASGTSEQLRAVCFRDGLRGTAVGETGTILRTIDGGETWTPRASGTTNTLNDVCFADDETGYIVGGAGTVLRTTDGGNTWVEKPSGLSAYFVASAFTDPLSGIAISLGGYIYRTTDGAENWLAVSSPGEYIYRRLYDVEFVDDLTGFAVGITAPLETMTPLNPTIYRTTDGGQTWVYRSFDDRDLEIHLRDVSFADESFGMILSGDGQNLWRTFDGGETWQYAPFLPNVSSKIDCLDETTITAAGRSCTILRSRLNE